MRFLYNRQASSSSVLMGLRSATHQQRGYAIDRLKSQHRWTRRGQVAAMMGAGCWLVYEYHAPSRHTIHAIGRFARATWIGLNVAWEYQSTFMVSRWQGLLDTPVFERRKRECHLLAAQRVLDGLQDLGGIYVKLGQHLSAMKYILPQEWTQTLAVLQDRCDPSSRQELERLFYQDCGQRMDDVFDEVDWNRPLGVASLAQVHKGRLRDSNQWVAIKLQHPRLDEFCHMDLQTVALITRWIKWWFPDFGFEWVWQELQESLPQELDFCLEAKNAKQVQANFAHTKSALVVPAIIWAQRRIICMEYIEGARVDNLSYMKDHGIDPNKVSLEITRIFSKMMFLDGFVHCDPHPGNLLIRPNANKTQGYNFDVVLLDHGLYRQLTTDMRTDFAQLWTALIRGDEPAIETYSLRVGCRPGYHRLFASLLTGREWHTIMASDLATARTSTEIKRVSGRSKLHLHRVAAILACLPRIVFLLLKTSDLVRHLNETLLSSKAGAQRTYVTMAQFCASAVWIDLRQSLANRFYDEQKRIAHTPPLRWFYLYACAWFSWGARYVSTWCQYELFEFALMLKN